MAGKIKRRNPKADMQDDTAEEIIRTLSNLILTSIERLSDEDLEDVDPMKLMKQASDLIRLTAYKKSIDLKNKKLSEVGFASVKDKVFEALARQYPELYEKLAAAIDELSVDDTSLDVTSLDDMSDALSEDEENDDGGTV